MDDLNSWFVRPETVVLPLSGGATITVRKRLNNGQQRDMFTRMYVGGVTPDTVNKWVTGRSLIVAYLVGWNLPVEIDDLSADDLGTLLDRLDPDRFAELKTAVEAHRDRQEALAEEEKKILTGVTP